MVAIAPDRLSLMQLQLPDTIADPTGFYRRLLDAGPVFDPLVGAWLVSRHADVQALLASRSTTVRMDHAGALDRFPGAGLDEVFAALDLHVSFVDGDCHRRVRRVLAEPIQVRQVRTRLAEPVRRAVGAAVDDLAGQPAVDLVGGFAARIPIDVTRHLLALPADIDTATVRRWSLAWGDVVAAPGHVPTTGRAATLATAAELAAFLRGHVADRERAPGTAVIDALVASMHRGQISREALVANLMMLLTAGNETTTNLLSAVLMVLADEPALWAIVRDDPDQVADVVTELGRLHPPTQYTARRLTEPVTLSTGETLAAGASVVLMLAAAGRDPLAFPDPGRILLDRTTDRPDGRAAHPVTFGYGAHACFGAPLARFEVETAVRELAARTERLRPRPGRAWRHNANLRGLERLPVQLDLDRTAATR
ncbi:cytochrome P450 [Dactylosporangium sp. CA-139066]|uniref:cytochrome P450 n=1 Tax=Dactylosporangium sp. CA-139066 TaxID=3239930 RepID=UPI003D8A6DCC